MFFVNPAYAQAATPGGADVVMQLAPFGIILVIMYFKDPGDSVEDLEPAGIGLKLAVYASALGTLVLGIFPGWVLDMASKAALK